MHGGLTYDVWLICGEKHCFVKKAKFLSYFRIGKMGKKILLLSLVLTTFRAMLSVLYFPLRFLVRKIQEDNGTTKCCDDCKKLSNTHEVQQWTRSDNMKRKKRQRLEGLPYDSDQTKIDSPGKKRRIEDFRRISVMKNYTHPGKCVVQRSLTFTQGSVKTNEDLVSSCNQAKASVPLDKPMTACVKNENKTLIMGGMVLVSTRGMPVVGKDGKSKGFEDENTKARNIQSFCGSNLGENRLIVTNRTGKVFSGCVVNTRLPLRHLENVGNASIDDATPSPSPTTSSLTVTPRSTSSPTTSSLTVTPRSTSRIPRRVRVTEV